MYSKYLKDIGIKKKDTPWGWLLKDKRQEYWKQERKTLGFDEREMWNLDMTLCQIIYPRLKHFRDHCIVFVDKPFDYKNETMSLEQALDKILDGFEKYMKKGYTNTPKESDYAFELLAFILPMLWN